MLSNIEQMKSFRNEFFFSSIPPHKWIIVWIILLIIFILVLYTPSFTQLSTSHQEFIQATDAFVYNAPPTRRRPSPIIDKIKQENSDTSNAPTWWINPPKQNTYSNTWDVLQRLLPINTLARLPFAMNEEDNVVAERMSAILQTTNYSLSSFPIAVIAYNRPELLNQTLHSLLQVDGCTRDQIVVLQDGNDAQVASVARHLNINIIQNRNNMRFHGEQAAAAIARHYKFSLTTVFDQFPNSQFVRNTYSHVTSCLLPSLLLVR